MLRAAGPWVEAARTEADGAFSARVPPGRYVLTLEGADRSVPLGEVTLAESRASGPLLSSGSS